MSQKRKQTPQQEADTKISTSTPIHDRSSKFQAIFSTSQAHLTNPHLLQQHPTLEGATHRILAWRKPSPQTSLDKTRHLYTTHSDEDGEKWAGKRLEKVLTETGVEAGVCVVGRWYGGVMLGPVRFEHIERCAREAIAGAKAGSTINEPAAKRAKLEASDDDEHVRQRLIQTLGDRDESVRVLRGLLVDKQGVLALLRYGMDDDRLQSKQGSPVKVQGSYEGMGAARLRTLEKARDATLAWILGQIEGVEREIEEVEELEEWDVDVGGSGDGNGDDGDGKDLDE